MGIPIFNKLDVGNGSTGSFGVGIYTFNVFIEDLGHGPAQGIIGSTGTTSSDGDERRFRCLTLAFFSFRSCSGAASYNQDTD